MRTRPCFVLTDEHKWSWIGVLCILQVWLTFLQWQSSWSFLTRKKRKGIFEIFQKLRVVFSLGILLCHRRGEGTFENSKEKLSPPSAGLGGSTKAYIIKSLPMDLWTEDYIPNACFWETEWIIQAHQYERGKQKSSSVLNEEREPWAHCSQKKSDLWSIEPTEKEGAARRERL